MSTGYNSPAYGKALKHVGESHYIERFKTSLIKRPIPGTDLYDVCSTYPFFSPAGHINGGAIIEEHENNPLIYNSVSLTLVTSPTFVPPGDLLAEFEYKKRFKTHHIVSFSSREMVFSHQCWDRIRHFAKSGGEVENVVLFNTVNRTDYAKEFHSLYQNLVRKHSITGVANFSEESIIQMFNTPGVVVFKAVYKGKIVGMSVFYLMGDTAVYHLNASNHKGYYLNAAYGLMYHAITFFKQLGITKLILGSNVGDQDSPDSGLAQFKAGWSNDTGISWILGKIINEKAYNLCLDRTEVSTLTKLDHKDFFPRYRI